MNKIIFYYYIIMVKNASGKDGYRSFTVIDVGKHGACKTKFHGGKYISKTPVSAAKKAFNELCRVKKIRGVCTLEITVKETTKNSKEKEYTYKLHRKKLKNPIIRKPSGSNSEYVIEYGVEAKSSPKSAKCKQKKQTRGRMKKRTARKTKKSANNVRKMKGGWW